MPMRMPRIVAIDHVRVTSPPSRVEELVAFYSGVLELDRLPGQSDENQIIFCGFPRRGPHLVVRLNESARQEDRRRIQIQIASLENCAERLVEEKAFWVEVRGWGYYDRRICTFDPAGNLVELVSNHAF